MPSASASVLCVTGHKEDLLARTAAIELAADFKCRVNVTVGLHIDGATAEDVRLLNENYCASLDEVKTYIGSVFYPTHEGDSNV
jgi:hypothetical protein